MAYLNVKDRVIEAKIVYYGAGLSGKTTNLEKVKARATEGQAGDMMTLETDGDRTLFFDWLPYNVGKFNGCDVKMQLYTVPGQAKYSETRKRVLSSADGVVLVLDSQAAALPKNRECVRDLLEHLKANGLSSEIPLVVQLNKRDLPTAMLADDIMLETGLAGKPYIEACASKGTGVFETLREVTRVVLESVRTQARTRTGDLKSGVQSGLDGKTLYAEIAGASGAAAEPSSDAAPPTTTPATPAKAKAADAPVKPTLTSSGVTKRVTPPPTPSAAAPSAAVAAPMSAPVNTAPANPSKSVSSPTSSTDPPVSSMTSASPAQVNEIIAAHRTLARRLDAIEVNVVKSVERALADLERRLMTRINEVAASTAAIQTRVETSDTATRVENGELRVSLNELEKKLKDDTAQRAKSVQAVIESSTRPLPAMVESAVKTGEALQAVDSTMRVATTLLKDISQGMQDRNGHVDSTIFGLHERSNVVEARLRELTELYADMMTEAKKSKSWWR